jgi:hypothetical protein
MLAHGNVPLSRTPGVREVSIQEDGPGIVQLRRQPSQRLRAAQQPQSNVHLGSVGADFGGTAAPACGFGFVDAIS